NRRHIALIGDTENHNGVSRTIGHKKLSMLAIHGKIHGPVQSRFRSLDDADRSHVPVRLDRIDRDRWRLKPAAAGNHSLPAYKLVNVAFKFPVPLSSILAINSPRPVARDSPQCVRTSWSSRPPPPREPILTVCRWADIADKEQLVFDVQCNPVGI